MASLWSSALSQHLSRWRDPSGSRLLDPQRHRLAQKQPDAEFPRPRFTNAHETMLWCSMSPQARYTFNYQSMKAFNEGIQMRSDWMMPLLQRPSA